MEDDNNIRCAGMIVFAIVIILAINWFAGVLKDGRDDHRAKHGENEPIRYNAPSTKILPLGRQGGEPLCYGSLRDARRGSQTLCRTCGGSRNYHASIQRTRPHVFVVGDSVELLPYEAGPHWEGGFPLLN